MKEIERPRIDVLTPGLPDGPSQAQRLPLVSVVVPVYNEAAILERNLGILCEHLASLERRFRWELVVVDDGSTDDTAMRLERFARGRSNIIVLHHFRNFGLGQALKFGFNRSRGDYIVTLDADLSYAPEHVELMLDRMIATRARIVVASPYMKGGRISHIPWHRRYLSVWANKFLSSTAEGNLATLTGMVRAYDGPFLRSLNLRAMGAEVNSKIIHQAMILQARIEEVPAHLDWSALEHNGVRRRSSLKILRHTMAVMLSGFLFRPVVFFIAPGLVLLALSIYANAWTIIHVFEHYQILSRAGDFDVTDAVAAAFRQTPHTFIIGGMTLMLAIQLLSLGILSLQSKHYFEETFYLGTTLYKEVRRSEWMGE